MNCNTTHYRANSSSVPGDPTYSDLGDSEQTPSDLATVADYAHLTSMMAPRGLLLTYNLKDNCCFASGHALPPLVEAAEPVFRLFKQEQKLRSHVNEDPGTHNFELDNRQALYAMVADTFFAGSDSFPKQEIDSAKEVKTFDELVVKLPEENLNFNSLAKGLLPNLPHNPALPTSKDAASQWQSRKSKELAQVVKYHQYALVAQEIAQATEGQTRLTQWRLRIGDAWTIPAVELSRGELKDGESKGTTILLCEGGRAGAAEAAERLLGQGQRVVAIDPFYFGESKIKNKDFLFALLVAAVGERPLGIQASQVAAAARWLNAQRKFGPVAVEALDQRTSLMALVAAALERQSIRETRLHSALGSLKEIVERNGAVDKTPEQFCFGLLEKFDIAQITALAAPNPVHYIDPSERAQKELSGVKAVYALAGREFDPVAR